MASTPDYEFLKGHGTENDFVLLPDPDGTVHGGLTDEQYARRVRALCDRRAGVGGDGVLRVVRSTDPDPGPGAARWFMDYRNADGSISQMCGNGIRVFVRYLVDAGLVDGTRPVPVATRDGVKTLTVDGGLICVDMGRPQVLGETTISAHANTWVARQVDMGNPHAVVFVPSLDEAGPLLEPPRHDDEVFPHGVNVEFVVRRGERHLAMRVHERGSGETRSCGTGACAATVAAAVAAVAAGDRPTGTDVSYRVDVPGGRLEVTWTAEDRVLLTGPAVLVAVGTTGL